ncbi:hypothetical protein [Actinoplanes sp. NBRC 103695]|uniref:hypothetical protein n=1 Tax=Actinoplanes sp. NBRC 103695 TaxID=3032202 RepID=UPI0024A34037|nr:hypothetical protein [Actinoplanes sp. NBRC 103695]GLY95049.1 hypothetical protein Acsp02_23040 [Actinoplanes sp. NBRC 103695]
MTDKTQPARVKGMGDWLIELHDWFRTELAELRRQAADRRAHRPPPPRGGELFAALNHTPAPPGM